MARIETNDMKLLYLELSNIGPFKGTQRLSLPSSGETSVHIIIGVNGSGKTTLLRTIAWALGFYDPGEDAICERLVQKDCESGYVKLGCELNGQRYEIFRTAFKPNKFRAEGERVITKILSLRKSETELIQNSQTFLREHFASELNGTLLRLSSLDEEFCDSIDSVDPIFKSQEFLDWALHRLNTLDIPFGMAGKRNDIVLSAMSQLGLSGPGIFAAGDKMVGTLLLCWLIRQWPHDTFGRSKNTHLVPWLLDCPLSLLDTHQRLFASWLVSTAGGDVVLLFNQEFHESLAQILAASTASVSVIRVGWNTWFGSEISVFNRKVVITRDDQTEHSEIVNLVRNDVSIGWDEPDALV